MGQTSRSAKCAVFFLANRNVCPTVAEKPCYSLGACQPPSSSTGAGLAGWATIWTRADEYTGCRDAVRLFGSGNDGVGIELGVVVAGIGSSGLSAAGFSLSGTGGLFAFSSNVRGGEAFDSVAGADAAEDGTLHDEHPEDGAPYTTEPPPPNPHEPQPAVGQELQLV